MRTLSLLRRYGGRDDDDLPMSPGLAHRATLVAVLRAAAICVLVAGLSACAGEHGAPETRGAGPSESPVAPASQSTGPEAAAEQSTDAAAPTGRPSRPDPLAGVYEDYVALGDSFTAGPLIHPADPQDDTCGRSLVNYPRLLARRLQVERLVDMSCSGAETRHLTERQSSPFGTHPPQLSAVRRSTDLVTLGIGGNDFGVFGRLITECARARADDPDGAPCRQRLSGITEVFDRTEERVADGLREIEVRAPEAEVVVVGYPRLAPEQGTCTDVLPFAAGDYAFAHDVLQELNGALRRAASAAGAGYVDVAAAAEGHHACAGEDAWVNGRRTEEGRALSYHPLDDGMVAVADLVHAELS
jgi:hypothetical protein